MKKRILSLFLSVLLVLSVLPFSALRAKAESWDIHYGDSVNAGQTATVTCYGGPAWAITNLIFEATGFTIGRMKHLNADGEVVEDLDIWGGFSSTRTFVYGGEVFIFEIRYGGIRITYNTANTLPPSIVCEPNDLSLDPLIRLNREPLFLKPGEKQALEVEWVRPGFSVDDVTFSSQDAKIAKTENATVTGVKEGDAEIRTSFTIRRDEDGANMATSILTPVSVVYDNVDQRTGFRFYYSKTGIEPGDVVQVGADKTFGDYTGSYYPGTVEWESSNPDVLAVRPGTDHVTAAELEGMAMGTSTLSLKLDGRVALSEKITVAFSDDTILRRYKKYVTDNPVMNLLSDARRVCWQVIEDVSAGDKVKMAFMTCLKKDLGLKVITQETFAFDGMTSGMREEALDDAINLLMTEVFSADDSFGDQLGGIKKKYKNYTTIAKAAQLGDKNAVVKMLAQGSSFDVKQVAEVADKLRSVASSSLDIMELTATAVLMAQYERDTVCRLMGEVSRFAGTGNDLYVGLERLLRQIDDLKAYTVKHYANDYVIDQMSDLVKKGLFDMLGSGNEAYASAIGATYKIASALGGLVAFIHKQMGGLFADDYLLTCVTSGIAGTLYHACDNAGDAESLRYCFDFYVPAVMIALDQARAFAADAHSYLLGEVDYYLEKIPQICNYTNLMQEAANVLQRNSQLRGHYTEGEDGKLTGEAYWLPPEEEGGAKHVRRRGAAPSFMLAIPPEMDGARTAGIAENGFRALDFITELFIPQSVDTVGAYAFAECASLSGVFIDENLSVLGSGAFRDCAALETVSLPVSLQTVGAEAFEGCGALRGVSLGENTGTIGSRAFAGCISLQYAEIRNKTCAIAADAFADCPAGLTIRGYAGSAAAVFAAEHGFAFEEIGEPVLSAEILTPALKTEYELYEPVSTDGLSLTVQNADGSLETVSDGWIAICDTSVSGERPVTVYYGDKSIVYSVIVHDAEPALETEEDALTMLVGTQQQLTARILPAEAANVRIRWTSDDESVVRVDGNGYLEAVNAGTAAVTASVPGTAARKTCTVTVTDTLTFPAGQKEAAVVVIPEADGWYKISSPCGEAKINLRLYDAFGNTLQSANDVSPYIEARLHGGIPYILYAACNAGTADLTLFFNKAVPATAVEILDGSGAPVQTFSDFPTAYRNLRYRTLPFAALHETVEWTTADETVAYVERDTLYFNTPGETTLTARSENGLEATCTVVVKSFSEAETLIPDARKTVTLENKDSLRFFSFTPEADGWYQLELFPDADGRYADASLLDPETGWQLAEISRSGDRFLLQYGFEAGKTYGFSFGSWWYAPTAFDVLLSALPPVDALRFADMDNKTEGYPYDELYLRAALSPTDHSPTDVVWTSSDETVASVRVSDTSDDVTYGYVSLHSPGEAVITAAAENGETDTITVTVRPFPVISVGERREAEIENGEDRYFAFTPAESGRYAFFSHSDETLAPRVTLYGAGKTYLESVSADAETGDFRLEYDFTAGETYLFAVDLDWNNPTGAFEVSLIRPAPAEAMVIDQGAAYSGPVPLGYDFSLPRLSVSFLPEGSASETVVWTSGDESVATVSESGYVTLVAPGETDITATSENGLTAVFRVTVTPYPTLPCGERTTVTIDRSGGYAYLQFTPETDGLYGFETFADRDVSYSPYTAGGGYLSGDYHSVDDFNSRFIARMEAGKNYIFQLSFRYDKTPGSFDARIVPMAQAESVSFAEGDSLSGYPDFTQSLTPVFAPENAAPETVAWKTSDPAVATVSKYGFVYMNAPGTAVVTATTPSGLQASCTVTVLDYPLLTGDAPVSETIEGGQYRFYFRFIPETDDAYIFSGTADAAFRFCITDAELTPLNGDIQYDPGETAECARQLAAGRTYLLRFTNPGEADPFSVSLSVRKRPAPTAIRLPSGINLLEGESRQLTAVFEPEDAKQEAVRWFTADPSVAEVDDNGLVTAVSPGETVVTAVSASGLRADCAVSVTELIRIEENVPFTFDVRDGMSAAAFFTPPETAEYMIRIENRTDYYDLFLDVNETEGGSGWFYPNGTWSMWLTEGDPISVRPVFPTAEAPVNGAVDVTIARKTEATGILLTARNGTAAYIGNTIRLYAEPDPWNAEIRISGWYSSDEAVATVDEDGRVTLVGEGTAVISAYGENGLTGSVTVTATDPTLSPVASMELVAGTGIRYVEGHNGTMRTRWNEETQREETYFHYFTDTPTDAQVRILFRDGDSKILHVGEEWEGYFVSWTDEQETAPWRAGTDNVSRIRYRDASVVLPITVDPNPVESISVLRIPSGTLIEGIDGSRETRVDPETGEEEAYFDYSFSAAGLEDARILIRYTDGSEREAGLGDLIDGENVRYSADQAARPWTPDDGGCLTVRYCGREVRMPVKISAVRPVSLTVAHAPDRVYYFGDENYGMLADGLYAFYPLDFAGIHLVLGYDDGTTRDIYEQDLTDLEIDGRYLSLELDREYCEGPCEVNVLLEYVGLEASYSVSVLAPQKDAESVSLLRLPDKTVCDPNFTPDFRGLSFRIAYTDGTSRDVTLSDENLVLEPNFMLDQFYEGKYCVFTVDGVEGLLHPAENGGYELSFLGKTCAVDGLTFEEKPALLDLRVDDFTPDGEGMTIRAYYADGSEWVCTIRNAAAKTVMFESNATMIRVMTERGILRCMVAENRDLNYVFVNDDMTISDAKPCAYCGAYHNGFIGKILAFFHKLAFRIRAVFTPLGFPNL